MRAAIIAGALLLLTPMAAAAQDADYASRYNPDGDSGLPNYAGLRGSLAFTGKTSSNVATTPPTALRASFNTGGGGSVYIGTRLPYGFRLEFEGLYRYLPVGNVSANGTQLAASGHAHLGAGMANLFYDVPVPDFFFRPFLGAGIGGVYVADSGYDASGDYLKQNNMQFGYQFMGGAELPLSQSSRLTAMYRWLNVNGVHGACGTATALIMACKSDLNTQSIDLGLEMDM